MFQNIADQLNSLSTGAPAFTVLIISFLAVGALEGWRPFFEKRRDSGGRLLTNFGLGLTNAALQFAIPLTILAAAEWAGQNGIGLLNHVTLPFAIDVIAAVLIYSLASYWIHRLSHSVPLFWRMHHVHHADTQIDLSTGFRNHPGELVVVVFLLSVAAIVFGLPPAVVLAYQIAVAGFALWTHADFALPQKIDQILRTIFVTPGMHHVHHSALPSQTDSNFGEVFSFWDRLFGSYCHMTPAQLRAMRIGLGDAHDEDADDFIAQLASPARRRPMASDIY